MMSARRDRALLRLAGALLALSLASPALAIELLPFEEVRPGMRGIGRTVFKGNQIEDFEVEILGRLKNIGPRQNLILARLSGGPLERTGVLAGMSGSPVYADGKLIGAIAYSWPFASEPIAGITPIHEMLRMLERDRRPGLRAAAGESIDLSGRVLSPDALREALDTWSRRLKFHSRAGGPVQATLPLLLSGFHPGATEEIGRLLGVQPVQSGSSASSSAPITELAPGSPVGARLIGGDLEATAIGTVTHREGDQILAFGHPLLNLGPTEIPMTTATVEALLPSLSTSFKFASGGPVVGSILEDRLPGLYGRLGLEPRTVPVRVEITTDSPRPRIFNLELVEDPLLTPLLLYVSLLNLISLEGSGLGEVTVALSPGSVIQVLGSEGVQLANMFSGSQSSFLASLTVAYIVYIIMNNEYRDAPIGAVNLLMQLTPGRRSARLGQVWTEQPWGVPGSNLDVYVEVLAQRERSRVEKITLEIPEEAVDGRALLHGGDALSLARAEGHAAGAAPRDLDHLIWLINHLRRNDRLYVNLAQADTGLFVEGERLPNLPPTQSVLIAPPQRGSGVVQLPLRCLAEEYLPVDATIEGHRLLYLEIRH